MLGACAEASGPHIETLLPGSAPGGAVVDVVGERFGGSTRSVAFGGMPARALSFDDRRARVVVPDGLAGAVLVVVTVEGLPSNGVTFFVGSAADAGP